MFTILAMGVAAAVTPVPPKEDGAMRYRNGTPVCRARGVEPAQDAASPRAQRLNELPDADLILGVMRIGSDGCSKPAIVRAEDRRPPRLR